MKLSKKIGLIISESLSSPRVSSFVVRIGEKEVILREGGDYTGIDLTGADLSGANLEGINLKNANLQNANLSGARLKGANLMGANLKGAVIAATTDLTDVCISKDALDQATVPSVIAIGNIKGGVK